MKSIYLYLLLAVLLCVAMILIIEALTTDRSTVEPLDTSDAVYGEVLEDFRVQGEVTANLTIQDKKTAFYVMNGHVQIRISNLTEVSIGQHVEGNLVYEIVQLDGRSINVTSDECSVWYRTANATVDCTLSRLDGENHAEIFNFYTTFTSFTLNGTMAHQPDLKWDLSSLDTIFTISNRTFDDGGTYLRFPANETPHISIVAWGYGRILPRPTYHVNGTLEINGFQQMTEDHRRIRYYETVEFVAVNLTIKTLREPESHYSRSIQDYVLEQPWFIEIRLDDGG